MKNNENQKLIKIVLIIATLFAAMTAALLFLSNLRSKNNVYVTINVDTMQLPQLEEPKNGDRIAIIETSLGEIKIVLYPQYSPKAVNNFIELADSGYYDNTFVFHSDSGVFSAAGSKDKMGSFSKGSSNERISRELSQDLWPFKGAVCMLNTEYDRTFLQRIAGGGEYYNGSRFAMLNTIEFTDDIKNELLEASASQELGEAFINHGGIPNFSQQMTIIGQAYEGLDVIEKLASLESADNGKYSVPNEDIMIISVKTGVFSEE